MTEFCEAHDIVNYSHTFSHSHLGGATLPGLDVGILKQTCAVSPDQNHFWSMHIVISSQAVILPPRSCYYSSVTTALSVWQ